MAKEIQTSTFVENILNILSNLPTGLRNQIVKNRLNEFLLFDCDEKKAIIKDILANYGKINNQSLLKLVESWFNSLSELRSDQINSIFYQYLLEISLNPDLMKNFNQDFINSLSKILISFPETKKTKLLHCFFEVVFNMPDPHLFMKVIPPIIIKEGTKTN